MPSQSQRKKTTKVYQCDSCEHVFYDYDSYSPLYECGECGTVFNRDNSFDGSGHNCPDCGKFGSRIDDVSCPECGEQCSELESWWECEECANPNADDSDQCSCGAAKAEE